VLADSAIASLSNIEHNRDTWEEAKRGPEREIRRESRRGKLRRELRG